MSEETRYRRFHSLLVEMPEGLLEQLLDVDHHDVEAIVAVDTEGDIVGGARYARDPEDPEAAEIAVLVLDEWRERGLAAHLLVCLARRADDEGVREFTAAILAGNRPTLEMVQRLGHVTFSDAADVVVARMNVAEWPDSDHSGAHVEPAEPGLVGIDSLMHLLGDEAALVTKLMRSWLDRSTDLASSLLIPIEGILRPRADPAPGGHE